MQRRKFLIGAGSLAAGSAAAVGTGAFTTVEADRDVSINVTDDANAYLSIRPAPKDPNGVHAGQDDDGEVYIDIADSGNDGDGVNPNAETTFDHVLSLRNKGTQDVGVWVEKSGDLQGCTVLFYPSNRGPSSIEGQSNAQNLPVGGGPTKIGVEIDTTKTNADEISGTITFHADAAVPNNS